MEADISTTNHVQYFLEHVKISTLDQNVNRFNIWARPP